MHVACTGCIYNEYKKSFPKMKELQVGMVVQKYENKISIIE